MNTNFYKVARAALMALIRIEELGKSLHKFSQDTSPFQAQKELVALYACPPQSNTGNDRRPEAVRAAGIIAALQAAGTIAKEAGMFKADAIAFQKEIEDINESLV